MKLIIDISEESYKRSCVIADLDGSPILKAIKNGIPLDDVREEIEATIDEEKAGQGNVNKGVVIGLQMTLTIIDKHISGEEQGKRG